MPYIEPKRRKELDRHTEYLYHQLIDASPEGFTFDEGELNYVTTKLCVSLLNRNCRYATANKLIGVLECVKQELYRKQIAAYEEQKESENGSVEPL